MSIEFRPCYGEKAKTLPPVGNIDSPPNQEILPKALEIINAQQTEYKKETAPPLTQLDLDCMLTARILNVKKRQNFSLRSYIALIPSEVRFNAYHWVTWFKELQSLKLNKLKEDEKILLKEIYARFIAESSHLQFTPGEQALLVHSLSVLEKVVELPQSFIERVFESALLIIEKCDNKELTMILRGAKYFFSESQKWTLFDKVSTILTLDRFDKMCFHSRVSFLDAFYDLEIYRSEPEIWNSYVQLTKACLNISSEDLDIKDVLTFLRAISLQSREKIGQDYIEYLELFIEIQLTKNNFDSFNEKVITLARSLKAFSAAHYLPKRLIPHCLTVLKDHKTPVWEKMVIFEALSMLGYKEILPQLKLFLNVELIQIDEKKQCPIWETIYPQELLSILRSIACLYPQNEQLPLITQGMVDRLLGLFNSLPKDLKMAAAEVCCALGYTREAKSLLLTPQISTHRISRFQEKKTALIIKKIHEDSALRSIETKEEFDVGGRNVSLLLNKKGWKQPIACEIDSHAYHFCCNDSKRYLGSNQLRNKFLIHMGYTVFPLIASAEGYIDEIQIRNLIILLKRQ